MLLEEGGSGVRRRFRARIERLGSAYSSLSSNRIKRRPKGGSIAPTSTIPRHWMRSVGLGGAPAGIIHRGGGVPFHLRSGGVRQLPSPAVPELVSEWIGGQGGPGKKATVQGQLRGL